MRGAMSLLIRPASSTEAPTRVPALPLPLLPHHLHKSALFIRFYSYVTNGRKLNNLSGLILLVWSGTWLPAELFACSASLLPLKVSKPPLVTYRADLALSVTVPSHIHPPLSENLSSHLFQNGYFFLVITQGWLSRSIVDVGYRLHNCFQFLCFLLKFTNVDLRSIRVLKAKCISSFCT